MATATTAPTATIEIENALNAGLFFLPLGRTLRGGLDFARTMDIDAGEARARYPLGIPGQRLELYAQDGKAAIVDPLAAGGDHAYEPTRERIKRSGFSLPPAREEVDAADVPTFCFWMRRAVEGGLARVVSGKIPEPTGPVKKRFFTDERTAQDPRDKTLNALVGVLLATLPADKRAAAEKLIADLNGD